MGNQAEMTRDRMATTRSHLGEKWESLEDQVSETVSSTKDAAHDSAAAVKETVDNVTAAIEGAMKTLGETIDLEAQARRHPWLLVGGSVALGCLAAQFVGGPVNTSSCATGSGAQGWLGEQVDRFKGLAISSVMSLVRDAVAKGLSGPLGQRVAEEVDHLTQKLGGEPIHNGTQSK